MSTERHWRDILPRSTRPGVSPGRSAAGCSVVITTLGGTAQCERLIESISVGTMVPEEIVVVNNLRRRGLGLTRDVEHKVTRVIEAGLGSNLAAARNLGWCCTTTDLCLFVDDDNVVATTMIEELVGAAEDVRWSAFAPVVVAYASDTVWCAGIERSRWLGRTRFVGAGKMVASITAPRESPDYPNSFMVRTSALAAVGGFDEQNFPIHYCEADLFARLRETGRGTVMVVPSALVYHDSQPCATAGEELVRYVAHGGPERIWATGRSRVLFFARHSRGAARVSRLCVGTPAWVVVCVFSVLGRDRPVIERFRVVAHLLRGVLTGYRDMSRVVREPRVGSVGRVRRRGSGGASRRRSGE